MSLIAKLSILVVGVLLISSCVTGPVSRLSRTDGDLRGMLYDLDRQPISDAVVNVKIGAKEVSGITDLHGRFGIGPLSFGQTTVRIEKNGFETLDWTFSFADSSQVLYLQMGSADQLFEKAAIALEQKDWEAFQENWQRAHALAPLDLQGVVLSATALELQGRAQDAIESLQGYSRVPYTLAIELLMGNLYSLLGEETMSELHWRRALELKEDAQLRERLNRH